MKYIYMDNFRGFSDSLVPILKNNFLVGENSTGKSSFLKLANLLFKGEFWFSPSVTMQDSDLGGFKDIISAGDQKEKKYTIGQISVKEDDNNFDFDFRILTFIEDNGISFLNRFIHYNNENLIKFIFTKKTSKYKTIKIKNSIGSKEEAISFFNSTIEDDKTDTRGFSKLSQRIPPDFPIGLLLSIITKKEDAKKPIALSDINLNIIADQELTWIAPIRTKPERFYGGLRKRFSPEGDHVPYILRNSLNSKSKSTTFVEKLKEFGATSGLFETILAQPFGNSPQSPFEILIKFSRSQLSINNVGYGVSQVLPLIVEFLSQRKKGSFAIQQPEVHLHPRAQAALGGLIYELSKERNHQFILETHSEYLLDRFRFCMNQDDGEQPAQVLFFERNEIGNCIHILPITPDGRYPTDQPKAFRDFFIKEEMRLLEI